MRTAIVALFAALLLGLAMAPAGANAAKVDNPSGANFRMEVTGGYLQFIGSTGTPLQLPLNFGELDPPLPNPALIGTITTNPAGYGVINVPNSTFANCALSTQAGICFPPIPVNIDDIALSIRLQPVGPATGFIDPLSGRVDMNIPIRLKAEGSALGQALGDSCFVGSASNPIQLGVTTHTGSFPTTNPTPAQTVYVADFLSDGGSFAGGWLAAEPYSDEAGVWAIEPKIVPGKPVGSLPKPLPSEIPLNDLTDYMPREAGSWRGMNETLAAPAAVTCGTGLLQGTITDQVNSLIGLPSQVGASSASLDFKFAPYSGRTGTDAMVGKAVKSRFVAPGLSSSPWPTIQEPTAVSAQSISLNASTSYFKVGGHPSERYSFDTGSGSFGAWSTNPVTTFNAPTIAEGADPIDLKVRVRVKDTEGDIDITTRTIRVVPATDISIDASASSVAGAGNFRGGSNGTLNLDVKNNSASDSSSLPLTLTASLPSGTPISNFNAPNDWTCNNTALSISCTLPAGALAAGATSHIEATLDVQTNAVSPAAINTNVAMAGDPSPVNNTDNISVPVHKTDLAVDVSHSAALIANGWFPYSVAVSNVGQAVTVGGSTVDVTLPSDFTYRSQGSGGTGWTCTPANPQNISCARSAEIAGNSSAPTITIWARIDRNTPNENRTVSATVSTQGDINANGGANSDDDTDIVLVQNDLAANVNIAGSFVVGDPGEITYSVTNESVVNGTAATTVTSSLPAGLTVSSVSGSGWDCSATVIDSGDISCVRAAGINGGDTTPAVTATVDVAQAGYPGQTVPVSLSNTEDAFAPNNTSSADVQVRRLDVAIQKLAVKPFNVGIEGRYRLNVTNMGDAATVGDITVIDTLPAGLKLKGVSGAGWDCSNSTIGGQDVTCVFAGTLGAGIQAAPIEIRVDVLDEAAEAGTVSNTAYVDTARDTRGVPEDAAVEANNTSTVATTAVAVDLSIQSRHQGAFRVGTEDVYSLDIRNVGFFGTDPGESITVTDDLPEGIVPIVDDIEATRPGWTCIEDSGDVTCTLEAPDALSSAMDPETSVTIDIPVSITDAAADSSDNVAEVSTARDANPALSPNNIAVDPTTVKRIDLAVSGNQTIAPRAGGIGEVNIGVTNGGSHATVEPTTVVMSLANGVSFRPSGSTTAGWSCSSLGAGTQVTCVRTQSIAAGGIAPALKIRMNVGATAPASWDTNLEVSTNGEPATRLTDNEATVSHSLETINLTISKSHNPAAVKAGKRGSFKIHVQNVGNTQTAATYRVQDTLNAAFNNVSASGAGWNCSVTGNAVDCTRTTSLAAGQSAPDITVGFDIPGTASGVKDSTATISSTDDPFTSNNSAGDPITIVATADVTVEIDQPSTMRVGDQVGISYKVTNVGTDSTAGAPSVKLKVGVSSGLKPIGSSSNGDWSCDPVEATESTAGFLDCEFTDSLVPGGDTTVSGQFEVIPTNDSQTGSLALVSTPGDVNNSNNSATAFSTLKGVDLEATVAAAGSSTEHMVAGTTATRVVTVTNAGTSVTTGPVRVSVDLPEGVQFDSGVANGTGWSCGLQLRKVTCERGDQVGAGQSAPALNLGLRASKSNAPSVDISYAVSTNGDENSGNDTATRTEEVRYNPETTITSGPSGTVNSGSASIEFTSDDSGATFACKVDSGAFETCTSPLSLSGLSIGEHVVLVKAINSFSMEDATPASISWSYSPPTPGGPNHPVRIESTGGTLSLASLGSVELPENQVKLEGDLYTDDGQILIPSSGVTFAPVEQVLSDVLGPGTSVTVTISISATGDALGKLPNGGGPATFTMPVRADVTAKLGAVNLIAPGTECALKPITFDFTGTYDESAGTVRFEQNNVSFPQITGCGTFKGTIDTLLELPRNDIEMALDFKVTKLCPAGQTGTPPNCEVPVTTKPNLAKVVVKGPKKVKSGKKFAVRASIRNNGDGDASNSKVCIQTPKKLIAGKANRCQTIASIPAGATKTVTFNLKAKKAAKKARKKTRANYTVTAPTGEGTTSGKTRGHVTVLK